MPPLGVVLRLELGADDWHVLADMVLSLGSDVCDWLDEDLMGKGFDLAVVNLGLAGFVLSLDFGSS